MTTALLTLSDIAQVRRLSLTTIRTSWKKRVKTGDIPAPIKGKGHPRWNPDKVAAFFSDDKPEPEAAKRQPRRTVAAVNALAAAMAGNS